MSYKPQSLQNLLADAVDDRFHEKVKPQAAPSTKRGYSYLFQTWTNYKLLIEEMDPSLCVTITLPWLRRFFKSLAQHPGIINERISIQALVAYVSTSQAMFKREFNVRVDREDVAVLKDYVRRDLKAEFGLKSERKRKTTLKPEDFHDIIRFIWIEDAHKYAQQRTQLQIHWLNIVLFYSVSRPGALVTSADYEDSGQYLSYKDCEVWAVRDENGGPPQIYLLITFRFRKNERNDDNGVQLFLWENLKTPSICPIKPFLAMASKDGLFGKHDPARLYRPMPKNQDKVQIKFVQSMVHLPILRMVNSDEPLRYHSWRNALHNIGFRMGYEFLPNSYSYRYHGANEVSKKANVAQLQLVMGHTKTDTFLHHYQTKMMIDTQSIVMGEEPKDLSNIGKTLSRSRNAPCKLPDELHQSAADTDEIRKLIQIRKNSPKGQRPKVSMKIQILRESLRRKALMKLRQEYFEARADSFWDDSDLEEEEPSIGRTTTLHPTRKTIVDLFYNTSPASTISVPLILEFMTLLDMKWMDGKPTPPLQGPPICLDERTLQRSPSTAAPASKENSKAEQDTYGKPAQNSPLQLKWTVPLTIEKDSRNRPRPCENRLVQDPRSPLQLKWQTPLVSFDQCPPVGLQWEAPPTIIIDSCKKDSRKRRRPRKEQSTDGSGDPVLFQCPYTSCFHHDVPLPSLSHFRDHLTSGLHKRLYPRNGKYKWESDLVREREV